MIIFQDNLDLLHTHPASLMQRYSELERKNKLNLKLNWKRWRRWWKRWKSRWKKWSEIISEWKNQLNDKQNNYLIKKIVVLLIANSRSRSENQRISVNTKKKPWVLANVRIWRRSCTYSIKVTSQQGMPSSESSEVNHPSSDPGSPLIKEWGLYKMTLHTISQSKTVTMIAGMTVV